MMRLIHSETYKIKAKSDDALYSETYKNKMLLYVNAFLFCVLYKNQMRLILHTKIKKQNKTGNRTLLLLILCIMSLRY